MSSKNNIPTSPQNKLIEDIFYEGGSFYTQLQKDINNAKKSIDLEVYMFNYDIVGRRFCDTLIAAALRGVNVRILVDSAGSPLWGGNIAKKMENAGVETRIFHPLPWRLWQWSRSVIKLPWILKASYLLLKINSRNHRKACTIDDKVAYVGSMNISTCHLNKNEGGDSWRDMAIRLENVDINPLKEAFDLAWENRVIHERIRDIFRHVNTNPIFRLNHTWHRRRILHRNLLRRISKTKERIWITNAYFVPDNFLLKKIKDAARNNIDVRILLPHKSDFFIMTWASSQFYFSLLKAGARIFEYQPSMLHAKTLILDNWVTIGSSNLNHRSLLHDLEVDVNVRLKETKQKVTQQFLEDLKHAKEIDLKNWNKRPVHQRLVGRLALYLKFWI